MFYERLKLLCKQNGTSPTAVAQTIGVSTGNVPNWKRGRTPRADVLDKIATHFNVSVDYLLGNSDMQSADRLAFTDADIKFALFGGDSEFISDEAFEDVRRFAQIVAEKERQKNAGSK